MLALLVHEEPHRVQRRVHSDGCRSVTTQHNHTCPTIVNVLVMCKQEISLDGKRAQPPPLETRASSNENYQSFLLQGEDGQCEQQAMV
jgi:hypothetical protein